MRMLLGSFALFCAGLSIAVAIASVLLAPVIELSIPWAQSMGDAILWAFFAAFFLGFAEWIFR